MILFIISFLLVFISSYFITSIIAPKKSILGLIYLFLVAFAQIVLTFEILSLFTAIKELWVLLANALFLLAGVYFWNKNKRPMWNLDCKDFRNRVINAFKLDKSLVWLYVGFSVLIVSSLFLCLVMPITNADAWGYHVTRSLFWVLQGNLNHFQISDIRCLCLPINSEILYAWVLLFVKKDALLGFFSFSGFVLAVISVYNILGYIGYCVRKRLWVIFILSSFASVLVQVSSTEIDIIIAGLVLASIFLFWTGLREDKKIPVFMSALAYALAIGTKTTAILMIPGVGIFMLGLCGYYKKYKQLLMFLGFGVVNFLIFSSYNYILNYLHFGNFITSKSFMVVSKNYYGIKGLFANFIKYVFMFFDFTGFKWGDYLNNSVQDLRPIVLNFFHLGYIKDGLYTLPYHVNRSLLEPIMGAGVLGFLVYLPCMIFSLIKPVFNLKSRKNRFIFNFALMFLINLIIISYVLAYMSFSTRFIMSFMVLSSPVLVYSYLSKKNPMKYIVIFFAFFYFLFVSTHLWSRPFVKALPMLFQKDSITKIRRAATCTDFININKNQSSACFLRDEIKHKYSKGNSILFFGNAATDSLYIFNSLRLEGYKIDSGLLEEASNIDFNRYNLVILPNTPQKATYIKNYKNWTKYYKKLPNGDIALNKKELVPCLYNENKRIPETVDYRIYETRCVPTPEFFKEKNLHVVGYTGLIRLKAKYYDYFTIYQNKNLPLIPKD